MQADLAKVGTADFSEICLLVLGAGEARAKALMTISLVVPASAGIC